MTIAERVRETVTGSGPLPDWTTDEDVRRVLRKRDELDTAIAELRRRATDAGPVIEGLAARLDELEVLESVGKANAAELTAARSRLRAATDERDRAEAERDERSLERARLERGITPLVDAAKERCRNELRERYRVAVRALEAALAPAVKANREVLLLWHHIDAVFAADGGERSAGGMVHPSGGGMRPLGWAELLEADDPIANPPAARPSELAAWAPTRLSLWRLDAKEQGLTE